MENFRDKMRQTFSTPNKPNSAIYGVFWSVLECFGVVLRVCEVQGGVSIPAEMALERVWQPHTHKGKIQAGVYLHTLNTSICCKVCNRQEQQRGLRNNDKDT